MPLQEFIGPPEFDEHKERFKDFFFLDRRSDGVLLARARTFGGPIQLSVQNHRALGEFLKTADADPQNEVLILAGSGEDFMMDSDPGVSRSSSRISSTGPTSTPTRTAPTPAGRLTRCRSNSEPDSLGNREHP